MPQIVLDNLSLLVDILKALAVIGAGSGVASLLTSLLVEANWPSKAKGLVALLVCVIGAFVMILASGINPTNLVVVIPTMWISCHLFYVRYFKPKGIAPWLETLFSHNQAS